MDTIHIDELLYPIGNGATVPLVATSNGEHYVIKTYNNIQGNKVLINELICYLIAKKLNIPIPDAKIGIIDTQTYIDNNVSSNEDFNANCYGACFCSRYIDPALTLVSSKMLKECNDYNTFIHKVMLFDHLIYNKDRNRGNLLINSSKNNSQLLLIDHSHTFNLEAIWNSSSLEQKIKDCDYKDDTIMKCNSYIYSKFKNICTMDILSIRDTVEYFKNNLNRDFFYKIIEEIPDLWENDKSELLSLANYLIYRFEHLDYYADLILSINY